MNNTSRIKKSLRNTIFELLFEIVSVICAFILPRLILSNLGSNYNGITQSISQFLGCIALLKSGIGSVTRTALYKPLAENDNNGISAVVNATDRFMKKIAIIFAIAVLSFSAVYPLFVINDFNYLFSFSLVLILAFSNFAQYFFGLTYQMVLQADQQLYIISIANILATILNTAIASVLLIFGAGIHVVKIVSAITFSIPPLFYNIYVKKRYHIDKKVERNEEALAQRWDAFGHQIANFINSNTDIIIATIFLGVGEVSVYTVHFMVASTIRKIINAVTNGTTAAFGNMIAKGENKTLKNRYQLFEFLIFAISTLLLTISYIMFPSFIKLYTAGVNDISYSRPALVITMCIAEYLMCVRCPFEQMIFAAGKFKETKNGAILEAIINITISIIFVNFFGLPGIMFGTICATLFRIIQYNKFLSSNIINRNQLVIVKSALYSIVICGISICATLFLNFESIGNFYLWVLYACIVTAIVSIITLIVSLIMYRSFVFGFLKIAKRFLKKGR